MSLDPYTGMLAAAAPERTAESIGVLARRLAALERGSGRGRLFREQTSTVETYLDTYQSLGGPTVTLQIPEGGAIAFVAGEHEADRFVDGGGLSALPQVALRITGYGDTQVGSGGDSFDLIPWNGSSLFARFVAEGTRTIEAVYRASGSANNPTYWTRFRNRRLTAGIFW